MDDKYGKLLTLENIFEAPREVKPPKPLSAVARNRMPIP